MISNHEKWTWMYAKNPRQSAKRDDQIARSWRGQTLELCAYRAGQSFWYLILDLLSFPLYLSKQNNLNPKIMKVKLFSKFSRKSFPIIFKVDSSVHIWKLPSGCNADDELFRCRLPSDIRV